MSIIKKNNTIYKATNSLDGKMYIGLCTNFKQRKARHLCLAKSGVETRFYNAIRKHGADNFVWDMVEQDIESLSKLKEREIFYIKLFDTYNSGYNSTLGGDGGFTGYNSGMFKKGVVTWNAGKKLSDEHIDKLRVSHIGLRQTEEQIIKRTRSLFKQVVQISEEGVDIREFPSIKEAANGKKSLQVAISRVCNKKCGCETAGGYRWKFKNN